MPYIKKETQIKHCIKVCDGCKECKSNRPLKNGFMSNKIFGKMHIKIIEKKSYALCILK